VGLDNVVTEVGESLGRTAEDGVVGVVHRHTRSRKLDS
jgi:hypothetical protein